jgi:hypothetical protein
MQQQHATAQQQHKMTYNWGQYDAKHFPCHDFEIF